MAKNETPDTVHGRLMESVNITGYTFQRVLDELNWLRKDDRWSKITGIKNGEEFVETLNWGKFKIDPKERKDIAEWCVSIGASQRTTAKMLGVSQPTITNDLRDKNLSPKQKKAKKNKDQNGTNDKNLSPESWFQSGVNPAEDASKKEETDRKRYEKESRREAKRQQDIEAIKNGISLDEIASGDAKFTTIVLDPPWDWGDENDVDQLGRARPTYNTIPFEELLQQPIGKLVANDAHIYLWITNRSLPKGFSLFDAWGFRYITCLTWCKPCIGMGNYFRGSSEQVLFGVKGSLSLKRKDVGTWFAANRPGKQSEKPKEFFKLVESCSPGPYAALYQREEIDGWFCWGNF